MWIKLLGAGIWLASGAAYARRRTRQARAQGALLDGFCAVLGHIRSQIELLCLPLDAIMAAMPSDMLAACGCVHDRMAVGEPVRMLCEASARIADADARAAARGAFERLGQGTREDQLHLCDEARTRLAARQRALADEAAVAARSRGVLVLSGGLAVVILLW